ncbi:DUF4865 family protein [Falsibacillus pallidus]|uniref:DUF4865 family protein n=1 Tax=Falsibacillus pallidus TaxID=493781 RepID=UPI003D98B69D
MIGMQYKVILPTDYDMGIIRKRVADNGHKTDGFPGLKFKAYLVSESGVNGNLYNTYAPLYVWNEADGMNKFVFEGYYDNILVSFGWQQIQIGVPLYVDLAENFSKSKYVVEAAGRISESKTLSETTFMDAGDFAIGETLGKCLIYNPDKWGYSQFTFYKEKPLIAHDAPVTVYEILHISQ